MNGRRRPDTPHGFLPDDIQRGDYWKVLVRDGTRPREIRDEPTNLTGAQWMIAAPLDGTETGYCLGNLTKHTVREHEDGTISVCPGDGSSNSILVTGAFGRQYHGYIERGVWT